MDDFWRPLTVFLTNDILLFRFDLAIQLKELRVAYQIAQETNVS